MRIAIWASIWYFCYQYQRNISITNDLIHTLTAASIWCIHVLNMAYAFLYILTIHAQFPNIIEVYAVAQNDCQNAFNKIT